MAFGQKKEAPKVPTFYLKPSTKVEGGYYGKIGDDNAELSFTPTGEAVLSCAGQQYKGKAKEGQWGPYHLFVIDGFFWFGSVCNTKYGEKFKLKQGKPAEDSAEWTAKKAQAEGAAAAAQLKTVPASAERGSYSAAEVPFDGGTGPAGLAAPQGVLRAGSIQGGTLHSGGSEAAPAAAATGGVRPPKPRGYNRPQ